MTSSLMGTKKQQEKFAAAQAAANPAKPAKAAAPRRITENEMAYQRVLRLTTSPTTTAKGTAYAPITHHDVHFHHVLDVLASGVNQVQDRRDVSHDTIDRMHGDLHKAMLHLNAHSAADRRQNHDVAAGHLNAAAGYLGKVAGQVGKHLGAPTITHTDGSQYPVSFLKDHVMKLSKHYQTKVANNQAVKAGEPNDSYEVLPNSADQMKAAGKKGGDKRGKLDTSVGGSLIGRVTYLDSMKVAGPHLLPKELADKGPTNTITKTSLSPAQQRLAEMPPMPTRRDHVLIAHQSLLATGKIGPKQKAALSKEDVATLHKLTGVAMPREKKFTGYGETPMPREREL